jgi:excisionase family DNA binding protein
VEFRLDTALNPNQLLNEAQTAELIGVSPQTLSIWRCSGRYRLPYIRCGRLIRYRRSDVEAWLESRTVRTGAELAGV